MDDQASKLLAGAQAASTAAHDMIEAVRDGVIFATGSIGSGQTLLELADALRLLLDAASGETEEETQLHGAVMRFLDAQS